MLSELNSFKRNIQRRVKLLCPFLLPRNFVLILYVKRANYVAKMWKSSLTNSLDSDGISENGWLLDGSPYWVDDIFPREFEEILCNPSFVNDLTNLMSKTSCRTIMMKIKTMTMMSERILIQISFKTASND